MALLVAIGGAAFSTHQGGSEHVAGALTSPDISSRYLSWNNVAEYRASIAIAATSSVACDIVSPVATSTLLAYTVRVDSNGIGALTADIATSTLGFATSSPALVLAAAVPTGSSNVVWRGGVPTTTNPRVLGFDAMGATGQSPYVLSPNTHVLFRIATTSGSVFSSYLTGACKASFLSLDR